MKYSPSIDLDQINPEIFDDYSDIDSLIRITTPFFKHHLKSEQQLSLSSNDNLERLILPPHQDYQDQFQSENTFNSSETQINTNFSEESNHELFETNTKTDGTDHKKTVRRYRNCNKSSKDKDLELKLSKKISDIKYRSKMREQYERLSLVIIGRDVKWRKKELLDLAVNYILQLKKSNRQLIAENIKLKNQLKSC